MEIIRRCIETIREITISVTKLKHKAQIDAICVTSTITSNVLKRFTVNCCRQIKIHEESEVTRRGLHLKGKQVERES